MHTPTHEVRLGASSRRTRLTVFAAVLLAAAVVSGAILTITRRPSSQPYAAEIRYARWDTPRRLTVAFRLVRTDGKAVVTHRCPDIVMVRADGTPFRTNQLMVTYMGISPDGTRMSIETRDVLAAPDGRPQHVCLRMVEYAPPPWWKQLLLRAKPTDDDPQPPIILPGSEVDVAAIAPATMPH